MNLRQIIPCVIIVLAVAITGCLERENDACAGKAATFKANNIWIVDVDGTTSLQMSFDLTGRAKIVVSSPVKEISADIDESQSSLSLGLAPYLYMLPPGKYNIKVISMETLNQKSVIFEKNITVKGGKLVIKDVFSLW